MKIWDAEEHARFERLESKVGELWILIDMLLGRSGLDADAIGRAHDYASATWKEIVATMAEKASDDFLVTAEGHEARRAMLEDQLKRRRQFWREDSREAGRILPDPTAGGPAADDKGSRP